MFALTILGNNSALAAYGRHPTAQILQIQEESYLIDCGEGTQEQLSNYKVKRSKINNIFISHMHGDHYFGLIGLLTSMGLLGRVSPIHLYAPTELQQIIQLQLDAANTVLPYQVHFHPLNEEGEIANDKRVRVQAFKVTHRIPCWGFIFTERKHPRTIDAERAKAYEIPTAFYDKLHEGEDYVTNKGTIIPNNEVTVAAPLPKVYAYCADTVYDPSLAEKLKNVHLLYHETTYLHDDAVKAGARFHSTTVQAAEIAKKAGVQKLLIGHFSSKYESLAPFLEEACAVFPNTALAIEGCTFLV